MSFITPILTTSPESCAWVAADIVSAAAKPARTANLIIPLLSMEYRHPREGGGPGASDRTSDPWMPACAGMTRERWIQRDHFEQVSDAQILVQFVEVLRQFGVADHVDDAAVLNDVVPVGDGRGEMEILLDEKDGEAL